MLWFFSMNYVINSAVKPRYSTCLPWQSDRTHMRHDDVIKWKHFPRNWLFVRGIHQSPVNSPHKGQWRGASTFSLICGWINDWVNNREAGDLRRNRAHYDVTVMVFVCFVMLCLDLCLFRVIGTTSLALGKSYNCSRAGEVVLKDKGNFHNYLITLK